jgi:eukaryotic-like serine/threonine-protein kinase
MPTMHTISGEPVLEGKYHLESRVGQGGMGVVYKARHAYLKTSHAIKIILPDLVGNDPELVTRFRQEALASAAIRHPNVVAVTDYGVAQGTMPFIVMEFVEGESLHDLLAREKRLSPEQALELVAAICAGISAAHSQGIVHRDMKPLNIMLLKGKKTIAEAVKILDFGLAKIKSGELLGSFIQAQTTGLMGSPYYMAPEQWSDEDLGPQSDIYSIGVMLYQMLAGDVPYKGSSIPAIMKKHLTDPPPPFAELGVQIDPALEQVVRHTLEKDPKMRTSSVEILVEELKNAIRPDSSDVMNEKTIPALPSSPLRILTNPPGSKVYLNNESVGESKTDGWLMLEGVQSGNHHVKVSHDGFRDWQNSIFCDGKPQQIVAKLEKSSEDSSPGIPIPTDAHTSLMPDVSQNTPANLVDTQNSPNVNQQTVQQQQQQTGDQAGHHQSVIVGTERKKSFFTPIILSVIGISGLLLLTVIVGVGIYVSGMVGGTNDNTTPEPTSTTNTNGTDVEQPLPTPEMVRINGGQFTMGRDDGTDLEKPEHQISVGDFWMDKTEVTNAEYYQFITETDHKAYPLDWVGEEKRPVEGRENYPVRTVNMEDIEKFIEWRSGKYGKQYRLPTEAEWEYVARNGDENTLYPWGDEFNEECAVVGRSTATLEPVGSKPCGASKRWGILDLIGNVFEWTGSEAKAYPGSSIQIVNRSDEKLYMIRGGSAFRDPSLGNKAETSTYRLEVPANVRDNRLGFRLVRSD